MAPPIPDEEERLLARVENSLAERARGVDRELHRYDTELVSLRDEIGEARLEDVPALIAQMERLQGISRQRAEAGGVLIDPASPYFGHLRLREQVNGRTVERDVMIGRATFIDPANRVNIVDWRNAPVSQLYYRYAEGDDYEERFADREVEGEILARRTLTIEEAQLRRIACPQGVWIERESGWEREELPAPELAGGEGTATRPGTPQKSVLGIGPRAAKAQRLDRHLPEIAALIDPRQFELMTAPGSGVVVIQGGAGSGKTTIGLHRIAYLTYAFPERFPPRRILVVTQGPALAAYISQVLPALGVQGVMVTTMADWAAKQMHDALPLVRFELAEDVPAAVSRLKFHPAVLHDLERRVREHLARPVAKGRKNTRAMLELWGDLLTDRNRLASLVRGDDALGLGEHELDEALRFIAERVTAVLDRDPAERRERRKKDDEPPEDDDIRGATGIDGVRTVEDRVLLDEADLALLLRTHQLMRGGKQELAHLFVDEAQDLSPLELAVLIGQTSEQRSVTLAGDTAQRLFLDNGFGDWRSVLRHLSLDHVAIEPLRIAYRSTREILALARHVMGPLADAEPPQAPRTGAPVEVHTFPGVGAAVAFCAEALRPLLAREPRATVAVIARHPEQADRYYEGLRRADVPALRRVRAQDFAFRPGIEVTDVRQVKGLEFDYVLLVDVNANVYGRDDEARHLLHIGATRAAHQLWLIVTGTPSPLLP